MSAAPNFRPMVAQLTRVMVLWGVVAALLVGGLQGWRARGAKEAALRESLQVRMQALASSLAPAVWGMASSDIQAQLKAGLTVPGVGCLAVQIGRAAPTLTAGRSEHCGQPASGAIDIVLPTDAQSAFQIDGGLAYPIWLGRLQFMEDSSVINREALAAAKQGMWVSVLTTCVILVGTLLLMRAYLGVPLRRIAEHLERFDADLPSGQLDLPRPPRAWHDEIDLVATALGAMQTRIRAHVQELDAKVAERTVELERALDTVNSLATTDALTGCANRLAFSQRFPSAVAHVRRYGRPLCVVFCDVDHFKAVNDHHGHAAGDRVLASLGGVLRQMLRASSDWVARYGGEEFVVVLPETALEPALDVAERIRERVLQQAVSLADGQSLSVTVSMGVAMLQPQESGEALLKRADDLLYAAKQAGRNCVRPTREAAAAADR